VTLYAFVILSDSSMLVYMLAADAFHLYFCFAMWVY